jgi:predicted transposase YbfD/YdcC
MNKFIISVETNWSEEELSQWLGYHMNNANDIRWRGAGFVKPIVKMEVVKPKFDNAEQYFGFDNDKKTN